MKDFHIHSSFSFDSSTQIEKYIDIAIKNNFEAICFTEHDEILQTDQIFKNYIQNIQKKLYTNNLQIFSGIEFDIVNINFLKKEIYDQLDFILCSFHQNSKTPVEYYINLYKLLLDNNNFNKIDCIAHIDFPLRYSVFASSFFEQFEEVSFFYLERILQILVENKISLEINAENFLSPYKDIAFRFWKKLIQIYRRKNGYLFTFGSDSHSIDDFINTINNRNEILSELELNENDFVSYKNHKITQ